MSICQLFAQANVSWLGFNKDRKFYQTKIVSADSKGFYVYLANTKERYIERYSHKLQLEFSRKLPFTERNLEVEEIAMEADHAWVFFSLYNAQSDRHGLFATSIPFDEKKPEGVPITLFDQQNIPRQDESVYKVVGNREFNLYAAMHYQQLTENSQRLILKVFNNELSPIQDATILLDQSSYKYEVRNIEFDPAGNPLVLIYFNDTNAPNNAARKYGFIVYRLNRFDGKVEKVEITGLKSFINTGQLGFDRKNNKILVSGFTASGTRTTLNGVFQATLGVDTFQLERVGFQQFNDDFSTKLFSNKNSRREKEMADYQIRHVVARTDGGSILIGESEYEITQTYVTYSQGFPTQQVIRYHYHDEIVVVSINPDGTIDWTNIIPKSQVSINEPYLNSFLMVPQRKGLRFIFNEDGRNRTSVLQFTIDPFGRTSPRLSLGPDLADASIVPGDALLLSENLVLIPGNKRKKKGIFRVTYKND